MRLLLLVPTLFGLIVSASAAPAAMLRLPFSQNVINADLYDGTSEWKYSSSLPHNESVIAPPGHGENWDAWYATLKQYQQFVRTHLNDPEAYFIALAFDRARRTTLNFNKVAYSLNLKPKEAVVIDGVLDLQAGEAEVFVDFQLKRRGEEVGNPVRQLVLGTVSRVLAGARAKFRIEVNAPDFSAADLACVPVVRIEARGDGVVKAELRDLGLSLPLTPGREARLAELAPQLEPRAPAIDRQLYDRPEMQWVRRAFVKGVLCVWDRDFYDPQTRHYRVREYCEMMRREFGGLEVVMLWQMYPNIGIDSRNQLDWFREMPGGPTALAEIVRTFHEEGVKVVINYSSWDIDTRREPLPDVQALPAFLREIGGDGIFMDVGTYALPFQPAFDRFNRGATVGPEITPLLQSIQGPFAVTSSWAQTVKPFGNRGVMIHKLIVPEHMQWRIHRFSHERLNELAFTWINGQGLIVWENVFGQMLPWTARERQALRKLAVVRETFADLYAGDSWKPYLPTDNAEIDASSWEDDTTRIWNLAAAAAPKNNTVRFAADPRYTRYYDLWTGETLTPAEGQITVSVDRVGAVLGLRAELTRSVADALQRLRAEHARPLPTDDPHMRVLSLKLPQPPPVPDHAARADTTTGFLRLAAGERTFEVRHPRREGECYPDLEAKSESDYTFVRDDPKIELILHRHRESLPAFSIGPRAVTNREFARFLQESGYRPRDPQNFLKHWGGPTCPDAIRNQPVVFVSLTDARAYAAWAGLRLPTEWEWQAAAETQGPAFVYNDVWEWTESERFDGHNASVILRGGVKTWKLQTSRWYFGGGTLGSTPPPGGPNPPTFHCKYYLMADGIDRSANVGFRCVEAAR
jgi:formylglycine-generating enzyme required for sulfatase activity